MSQELPLEVEQPTGQLEAPKHKKSKVREDQFFPALLVKDKTGDEFAVPTDSVANALANQLMASKLRKHYMQILQTADNQGLAMEPKALKELYGCAEIIARISADAYSKAGLGPEGENATQVGKVAGDMVKQAMDGMTTALMRQKKLDELGKKKKEEAIKI